MKQTQKTILCLFSLIFMHSIYAMHSSQDNMDITYDDYSDETYEALFGDKRNFSFIENPDDRILDGFFKLFYPELHEIWHLIDNEETLHILQMENAGALDIALSTYSLDGPLQKHSQTDTTLLDTVIEKNNPDLLYAIVSKILFPSLLFDQHGRSLYTKAEESPYACHMISAILQADLQKNHNNLLYQYEPYHDAPVWLALLRHADHGNNPELLYDIVLHTPSSERLFDQHGQSLYTKALESSHACRIISAILRADFQRNHDSLLYQYEPYYQAPVWLSLLLYASKEVHTQLKDHITYESTHDTWAKHIYYIFAYDNGTLDKLPIPQENTSTYTGWDWAYSEITSGGNPFIYLCLCNMHPTQKHHINCFFNDQNLTKSIRQFIEDKTQSLEPILNPLYQFFKTQLRTHLITTLQKKASNDLQQGNISSESWFTKYGNQIVHIRDSQLKCAFKEQFLNNPHNISPLCYYLNEYTQTNDENAQFLLAMLPGLWEKSEQANNFSKILQVPLYNISTQTPKTHEEQQQFLSLYTDIIERLPFTDRVTSIYSDSIYTVQQCLHDVTSKLYNDQQLTLKNHNKFIKRIISKLFFLPGLNTPNTKTITQATMKKIKYINTTLMKDKTGYSLQNYFSPDNVVRKFLDNIPQNDLQ